MSNKLLYPITVESYSGYRQNEQPRCFKLLERTVIVTVIQDRWYQQHISGEEGTAIFFRVRGNDGKVYVLKNNLETDDWFCVFNDSDVQPNRFSARE